MRSLVPSGPFNADYAMTFVGLMGTTISPYLFFWQAQQEVEEASRYGRGALRLAPGKSGAQLRRIGLDTGIGMFFSQLVALAIIIATAVTLHTNGITNISTSAEAAQALRPLAGDFAFLLFAAGIVGTGMLAVPVLAGSVAYAVAESFQWVASLERRPAEAPAFYGVIAIATVGGLGIEFVGISPIKALYYAAVINGVLAAPLILLIVLIAGNGRIMGRLKAPRWMLAIAGLAGLVMAAATVSFLVY
jgi:Mn2+/Fe2+ NRAMP family transporter